MGELRNDERPAVPPPLDQVSPSGIMFSRSLGGNAFQATLDAPMPTYFPRSPSQPEVTTPSDSGRNAVTTPWTAGQRGAPPRDGGDAFGGPTRSLDFEDQEPQGQVFYVPRSKSSTRLNDDLR